jgi:hypothetical protein
MKEFLRYRQTQEEIELNLARKALEPLLNVMTEREAYDVPKGWSLQVNRFIDHLHFEQVYDIAKMVALRSSQGGVATSWSYFTKCCHRRIKEGF